MFILHFFYAKHMYIHNKAINHEEVCYLPWISGVCDIVKWDALENLTLKKLYDFFCLQNTEDI